MQLHFQVPCSAELVEGTAQHMMKQAGGRSTAYGLGSARSTTSQGRRRQCRGTLILCSATTAFKRCAWDLSAWPYPLRSAFHTL